MFKGHLNQTPVLYWCHHSPFHTACHPLACCDSVFEQRAAPRSERLSVMFSCMAEYTESQRIKCMSSHWAPFQCWHKARWFTPVVSGTKQFFFLACTLDKVTQLGKYLFCVILAPNTSSDFTYAFNNKDHISSSHGTQSIYSEGLSMLMKDKAKGQDKAESMAFRLTWIKYAYFMWTEILKRAMSVSFYSNLESFLVFF